MSVLIETMALVWSTSSETRLFLAIGMLGAFTTFSLDLVVLYERRALWPAVVYVVASVGLSIAALFAGLLLMRRLLSPAL